MSAGGDAAHPARGGARHAKVAAPRGPRHHSIAKEAAAGRPATQASQRRRGEPAPVHSPRRRAGEAERVGDEARVPDGGEQLSPQVVGVRTARTHAGRNEARNAEQAAPVPRDGYGKTSGAMSGS